MSAIYKFDPEILIVGSTNHAGEIDSFAWEDVSLRNLELDNYHTFILNLHSINSSTLDKSGPDIISLYTPKSERAVPLASINEEIVLNLDFLNKHLMFRNDKSSTSVILLVNPTNKVADALFNSKILIDKRFCENNNIKFKPAPSLNQGQFVELYLDLINNHLINTKKDMSISMINPSDVVKPYFDTYDNFDFVIESIHRVTPLAHTFYNATLSFIVSIEGIDFFVLPHPNLVSPYDVVETVIRGILEIQGEARAEVPKWIDNYSTGSQMMLSEEINELGEQIQFLKNQIKAKEAEYLLYRQFQEVLYIVGAPLIQAVIRLLETMNLQVNETSEQYLHDFEIMTHEGIIVGQVFHLRGDTIERQPFRALNQHVESKEEEIDFTQKVKGLLVLAHNVGVDPKNKVFPEIDNPARLYAERNEFCIVTVEQIYSAYLQIKEKQIMDPAEFVSVIFKTSGYLEDNRFQLDE